MKQRRGFLLLEFLLAISLLLIFLPGVYQSVFQLSRFISRTETDAMIANQWAHIHWLLHTDISQYKSDWVSGKDSFEFVYLIVPDLKDPKKNPKEKRIKYFLKNGQLKRFKGRTGNLTERNEVVAIESDYVADRYVSVRIQKVNGNWVELIVPVHEDRHD